MLPVIRKKAGLGENLDTFYTNMNEQFLKKSNWLQNELRPFVDKMYAFVESQENLIRKVVIHNNHWRFRQEFQHLEIDSDKWFTLSEKAQKCHINKVLSVSLGNYQELVKEPVDDCSEHSSCL